MSHALPFLSTCTIGRCLHHADLRQVWRAWAAGELGTTAMLDAEDELLSLWAGRQQGAGLDCLTDGELWLDDMGLWLPRWLDGISLENCSSPGVVQVGLDGEVRRRGPLGGSRMEVLRSFALPVRLSVPGPNLLKQALSGACGIHESPERELAWEQRILGLLRDEVSDLMRQGVAVIQVREPLLPFLRGMALERAQTLVNGVTDYIHELSAVRTAVWVDEPGQGLDWVQGVRASQVVVNHGPWVPSLVERLQGKEIVLGVLQSGAGPEGSTCTQADHLLELMELLPADKIQLALAGGAGGVQDEALAALVALARELRSRITT